MANYMTLLADLVLLIVVVISSSSACRATDNDDDSSSGNNGSNIPSTRNQDMVGAIEEMQRANYFTFVMLLNMAPANVIQGNVTFLMPRDRTLANAIIPENAVVDFLLRHSIPSPLLFDHLQHIPTGSLLPTSSSTTPPRLMLKVTNHGRKHFFLSNARIVSPNICTRGSSIRCHGIDEVLHPTTVLQPPMIPPSCPNNNGTTPPLLPPPLLPPPPPAAPLIAPLPSPSPSPSPSFSSDVNSNPDVTAAPPPADVSQHISGSDHLHNYAGLLEMATTCLMLMLVKLCL